MPKAENRPATAKDLNIKVTNDEISHILISGGIVNEHGLAITGKSLEWLSGKLQKKKCSPKDVFLMTLNDSGQINIIMKEKRKKK